jgi:23S rRNA (cytidine1920-2'-O)/16S rRNA (cytidine1409-2'-O)-methyltransferase
MACVMTTTTRRRLDLELVERGLADSRNRAQALVAAGLVLVDGSLAASSAQPVGPLQHLVLRGPSHPWAGRGGVKLEAALEHFRVDPAGRVCLDAGASTGGFTDVLLSHGAARVYAVDVGHGQLLPRLAADPRVTILDRTNVRQLPPLPGPAPDLLTLDLSFISLRTVLPALVRVACRPADVVALFKPQFELGRGAVGRGGVVRDQELTADGLRDFAEWARSELGALQPAEPFAAPIRGSKGNQEHLVHLVLPERG